ncbi:hypothetical protein [Campylobacter ureolyticus]|nr:hypothetical protein [Campylobacter ureolyticus]
MDRKFTMQYRNILKYKGIAIIKKNKETIIKTIPIPNEEFNSILKEHKNNKSYHKEKNLYALSLLIKQEAEDKFKKI